MENDKNFKSLLQSEIERSSPDFTRLVMHEVKANVAADYEYSKWKKIFATAFITISFLVFALCFFSKAAQQIFDTYINIPVIAPQIIYWIVTYIFSFWILIIFSFRQDKRKLLNG